MSIEASFLPPQQCESAAANRVHEKVAGIVTRLGKAAVSGLLVAAGTLTAFAAREAAVPVPAAAAYTDTGDYPWADAAHVPGPPIGPAPDAYTWGYTDKTTCDSKSADYDCGSAKVGTYYYRDQWGYDLNNCTSYVAWRLAAEFGADASGMENATRWDNHAAAKGWRVRGARETPEVGDIAQTEGDDTDQYAHPGHAAFVVEVGSGANAGKVKVEQYNAAFDGKYSKSGWVTADHFIDVNGPNPPDFTLKIGPTAGGGGGSAGPGRPAAIARSAADMDVFYRDSAGNLRNSGWTATAGWGVPALRVSGGVTGNPAAVARGAADMDVFFVDSNGQLRDIGWNATSGWGIPTVRAAHVASDPLVIARDTTDMDVFYRNDQNDLMNVGWNAASGWGVPTRLSTGDARGNPAATARDSADMEVAYRDAAGNLRTIGWSAITGWGAATIRINGAGMAGDPSIVSRSHTSMEVFYRAGYSLMSIGWDAASGWGAATNRSANTISDSPAGVARGDAAMSAFYRGTGANPSLMESGWSAATGWGAATAHTNGGLLGPPVAISRTATNLDVFFKDSSGYLKDAWWDASVGWHQTVLPGTNNSA